jgi:hypothetical protein
MKMHLNYSFYLLSMANFKKLCNFNALLKMGIENIVLFLYFKKTKKLADFKGLYNVCSLKKIHIKKIVSQLK